MGRKRGSVIIKRKLTLGGLGYWEFNNIRLQPVSPDLSYEILFRAKDGMPPIIKMVSSCSCSVPSYNQQSKILSVVYHPKKKASKPEYSVSKTVTLHYNNGETEQLRFTTLVTSSKKSEHGISFPD